MPTAEQFRHAAEQIRHEIGVLERVRLSSVKARKQMLMEADDDEQQLAADAAEKVVAAERHTLTGIRELEHLAATYDARADLCDEYAAEVAAKTAEHAEWLEQELAAAHEDGRDPDWGTAPKIPDPPYAWVEL